MNDEVTRLRIILASERKMRCRRISTTLQVLLALLALMLLLAGNAVLSGWLAMLWTVAVLGTLLWFAGDRGRPVDYIALHVEQWLSRVP